MKISKDCTVHDLQIKFKAKFPMLKLKFYKVSHEGGHGSMKKDEVADDTPVIVLNPELKESSLPISREMSVEELEDKFEKEFALHVQVFRKSGETWLQTSVTDHWTLDKHMKVAEETERFQAEEH